MPHGDDAVQRARQLWRNRGNERPPFADVPGDGQESVWDYPRPPALVADSRLVVRHEDTVIAETRAAMRVLETASPPTFYLPPEDCRLELMPAVPGTTFCEWKGRANYRSLVLPGVTIDRVAWLYEDPYPEFASIAGYLAFYPGRLQCFVDGERVRPQPGDFYGGWITADVVGPFKGDPGTGGW